MFPRCQSRYRRTVENHLQQNYHENVMKRLNGGIAYCTIRYIYEMQKFNVKVVGNTRIKIRSKF